MKELFNNKTQMKKHIKIILNGIFAEPEEIKLILWLVAEYRGEAVAHVWTQKDHYGNKQFSTHAGSFSYIKAVDFIYGKKETNKERFTLAMRRQLIPYMREIKNTMLRKCSTCPHTSKEIDHKNAHLDHVGEYEFSDIMESFLPRVAIDLIQYRSTNNGDFVEDIELFNEFKKHHDNLAKYEVVHSSWNLSRGKK